MRSFSNTLRGTRPLWASLAVAAVLALPATPAAFASAGPPASCAGQDSSTLATSLGSGFAGLVTELARTGTLGQFTDNEAHLPTGSCPF
jgi:hypothetical protein